MAKIIIGQQVSNEIFEVFVKLPLKMLKGTAGWMLDGYGFLILQWLEMCKNFVLMRFNCCVSLLNDAKIPKDAASSNCLHMEQNLKVWSHMTQIACP